MSTPNPRIVLGDDGTLDTVLWCSDCGEEFRYNFDVWEHNEDCVGRDCGCYNAFVEWAIEDADADHDCEETDGNDEETNKPMSTLTAQELARYIGKIGYISSQLGTIKIPILVRDAKELHGRIYLAVVPTGDGEGEAWVDRGQVTIHGGI